MRLSGIRWSLKYSLTYPDDRERVPLLVVQVLLDVEEGVKEDVGQLAPLQVPKSDLT